MGFWRDIGNAVGVCDWRTKEQQNYETTEDKAYAASRTGHALGCTCHWCMWARLGGPSGRG